jgi:hypothetical protein
MEAKKEMIWKEGERVEKDSASGPSCRLSGERSQTEDLIRWTRQEMNEGICFISQEKQLYRSSL